MPIPTQAVIGDQGGAKAVKLLIDNKAVVGLLAIRGEGVLTVAYDGGNNAFIMNPDELFDFLSKLGSTVPTPSLMAGIQQAISRCMEGVSGMKNPYEFVVIKIFENAPAAKIDPLLN